MSDTQVAYSPTARLGFQYYSEQNYVQAEAELKRELEANPNTADVWRILGFAQYAQKNVEEATNSLQRAVALDGSNVENHYGLGLAWANRGMENEAIASYDEALKRNPTYEAARNGLVGALMNRGQKSIAAYQYTQGEGDIERAIKIHKTYAAPVTVLARHYIETGQKPKATKLIEESLTHLPDSPEIVAIAEELGMRVTHKIAEQTQAVQAKAAVAQAQMQTCPACKAQIAEWASICPNCKTQIKAAPSQFSNIDPGPAFVWQEIAYYICSVLWLLEGGFRIFAGTTTNNSYEMVMGAINVCVAIGLLMQNELMQNVAKYLCYFRLLGLSIMTVLSFGVGAVGYGFLNLAFLCITGLMTYLISFLAD